MRIAKIIFLVLISGYAMSANLEYVKILEMNYRNDEIVLKLHDNKGDKDNFFFVNLNQSDKDLIKKMAIVIKKIEQKEQYPLKLKIQSFSRKPFGSKYRSEYVGFESL